MISVTGYKEIDLVLRSLPKELSDKVLKQAHSDAAIPLVNAAHFLAPVGKTGNLADSIGVEKIGIARGGSIGQVNVGPRRKGGFKGFHGHLIEYGKTNRDGSQSKPHPFMAPAFEQTKSEVEKRIADNIGRRVLNLMRRIIRNG